MFKSIKYSGYEQFQKDRIDIYFNIELFDEFYIENNISEKENPKDAWCIQCSQIEEDRESGSLWIDILNEGMQTCFALDQEEVDMIYKIIIDNNIDKEAGLVLKNRS